MAQPTAAYLGNVQRVGRRARLQRAHGGGDGRALRRGGATDRRPRGRRDLHLPRWRSPLRLRWGGCDALALAGGHHRPVLARRRASGGFGAPVHLDRLPRKHAPTWPLQRLPDVPRPPTTIFSQWPERVATVPCRPLAASFVGDAALCVGVTLLPPFGRAATRVGGSAVGGTVGVGLGHVVGYVLEAVSPTRRRDPQLHPSSLPRLTTSSAA